ncbi:hypothetical protein [Devosia sp. 2618]|uniref:hypothetical protein n=1 Tax=Devosia sp. 2618 TaxID=3156454 RepID=UPI00339A4ECB
MSPEQVELARHALGLPNRSNKSYRNRFVTAEDDPNWCEMVRNGEARMRSAKTLPFDGDALFWLTIKGATAALKGRETLCPEDFPVVVA